MNRKVLFLGFADLHVDLRQYEDREIWTMNDFYQWFPWLRPAKIFEIHKAGVIEDAQKRGRYTGDYKFIYNACGSQIITRFSHGLRNEQNVCDKELAAIFGEKFFVGTFSYMFAWAILLRYQNITIEGIHLKEGMEYCHQVPGMVRNIDKAREQGIKVDIPGGWEKIWRFMAAENNEKWEGMYG